MGDSQLLPPTDTLTPGIPTPSGLTPNTRSEAEAALTLNSLQQTESAAPTTPLPHHTRQLMDPSTGNDVSEAQQAYHRPSAPLRTSSTNYESALLEKARQESVSSNMSDGTIASNITEGEKVGSPVSTTTGSVPFPPAGQGVVPLHSGVGAGQQEALKRQRPHGLSLGALGRQQSWSEQDMKHVYTGKLLEEPRGDAGYSSGTEGRAVGP